MAILLGLGLLALPRRDLGADGLAQLRAEADRRLAATVPADVPRG